MSPREMQLRRRPAPRLTRLGNLFSGRLGSGDELLMAAALGLTALGLVMVYSASVYVSEQEYKVDWFIFARQARLVIVGLAALVVGMAVKPELYRRLAKLLLAGFAVVMLLQLVTPLGPVINNTRRWVDLGVFNLQTSDVARCLVVMFLARTLAKSPEIVLRPNKRLFGLLPVVAVPVLLTYLQPDLSGSLMIALAAFIVMFVAGLSFLNIAMLGAMASPVLVYAVLHKPYQLKRLVEFGSALLAGREAGYQTMQSLIGFGNGGLFGVGLGMGKQKMLFLPTPHTDFIFAITGEELGLVGTTLVLGAFLLLTVRIVRICRSQSDLFRMLLGAGLGGSLVALALINMGVATGLLPVTGLPLPFISSGGTSLVVSLWSVGVLWRLSRRDEVQGTHRIPVPVHLNA